MSRDQEHHVAALPRGRDVEVRVALREYKGHRLVDVRQYFRPVDADAMHATGKGVNVRLDQLDALLAALQDAKAMAIRMHWLSAPPPAELPGTGRTTPRPSGVKGAAFDAQAPL